MTGYRVSGRVKMVDETGLLAIFRIIFFLSFFDSFIGFSCFITELENCHGFLFLAVASGWTSVKDSSS